MKNLIKKVVKLQNEFNEMIDKDWVYNKKMNFRRASWLECAELMESTNWKWWENQQVDEQNIEVELVDILHFVISQVLRNNIMISGSIEKGINHTIEDFLETIHIFKNNKTFDKEYFQLTIEELVKRCLIALDDELLEYFVKAVNVSSTNIENVLKMYVAKNVLNKFRQDNGYKEGTYIKQWGDAEDNVICWNLAKKIKSIDKFENELYRQLGVFYEMVKQNKQ